MADEWINFVIQNMENAGGDLAQLAGILKDNNSLIQKVVVAMDRKEGELHAINLGKKLNDGPG